jgi:hypothetical protein
MRSHSPQRPADCALKRITLAIQSSVRAAALGVSPTFAARHPRQVVLSNISATINRACAASDGVRPAFTTACPLRSVERSDPPYDRACAKDTLAQITMHVAKAIYVRHEH